ncbi:MAG: hypothetical protein IRY91_04480 [Gemmatimonadaceae bacterium]|nr:hypothetical protein [Gemmatimonadaceae bacterium]
MLLVALFTAAVMAAPGLPSRADSTGSAPPVQVTVDSAHAEIVVTAGPFHIPAMMPMEGMEDMPMDDMHPVSQLLRFQWPVHGWMRGFRVDVVDKDGKPLPASLLHHLIGVNFDRRQLVYPAVERLFGWGAETDPVELPKSLGVPLHPGEKLGMYAMFHNETGKDVDGAYLRLTLLYTPQKGNHPVEVLPFYVDVNNVIGGQTWFDVPPGKSTHSYTFELPVGVKLIGVGGHLHDYGSAVMLEDAKTGKVLVRLKAKRDDAGHVKGVGRFIFGFNSDALHLEAHHPYRVVAEYDNPTKETFKDGGMGHINGAIIPDDMSKWPKLDLSDPLVQKDIATLPSSSGMSPAGHTHSGDDAAHGAHSHAAPGAQMQMQMDHMHHPGPSGPKPDSGKADSTRHGPTP